MKEKGAEVSYHDPYVPAFQHDGTDMAAVPDLETALRESDCAIVVTDHTVYDWDVVRQGASIAVDTRRALNRVELPPATDGRRRFA